MGRLPYSDGLVGVPINRLITVNDSKEWLQEEGLQSEA